jgi:hypothetical protein
MEEIRIEYKLLVVKSGRKNQSVETCGYLTMLFHLQRLHNLV